MWQCIFYRLIPRWKYIYIYFGQLLIVVFGSYPSLLIWKVNDGISILIHFHSKYFVGLASMLSITPQTKEDDHSWVEFWSSIFFLLLLLFSLVVFDFFFFFLSAISYITNMKLYVWSKEIIGQNIKKLKPSKHLIYFLCYIYIWDQLSKYH